MRFCCEWLRLWYVIDKWHYVRITTSPFLLHHHHRQPSPKELPRITRQMPARPPSTASTRVSRTTSRQSMPASVSSVSFSTSTSVTVTARTPNQTVSGTFKPPPSAALRFSRSFAALREEGCEPQTPPTRRTPSRTASATGSARGRPKTSGLISDSSPHNRVTQSCSMVDSAKKSTQQSPLAPTRSTRMSGSISSAARAPPLNARSPLQKSITPGKNTRQQSPRQISSVVGGLPGVPWSPQGSLTRRSISLLADSPASLDRKFHGDLIHDSPSFQLSLNGDAQTSVWDGEDMDMSYELVTDIDDADVDEDVRLYSLYRLLLIYTPSRCNLSCKESRSFTLRKSSTTNVSWSKANTRLLHSYTRYKRNYGCCVLHSKMNAPKHARENWSAIACR